MYVQQCQKTLCVFVLAATLLPLNQRAEAWTQSGEERIEWNDALDQEDAWYTSPEAIRIADNVLAYQDNSGGWPKNIDMAQMLSEADRGRIREEQAKRGATPNNITIDNGATHTQMRYLARVYNSNGQERFKESFLRGVEYLLKAQYDNGGWPQYYPIREGYYEQITFNDGAMIGVLDMLHDIATGQPDFTFVDTKRRTDIKAALKRGIENILRTQIRQNGKLTAWCAQHDKLTLEPAWARAYEPPSLSGGESVGIVRFLMSIEEPTPEIIAAIEGAVSWLKEVAIQGLRYERFSDEEGKRDRRVIPDPHGSLLWARFYELGSNRPIFLGRDSVVRYALAEIEQERRNGYAYYGTWAKDLLENEYPLWKSKQTSSEEVISRSNRHRVIISADFPPLDVIPGGAGYGPAEKRSDPDDVQSMVRFLLYTNVLDVEGIIASSGTFANIANKNHILDILDLYDQVDEHLMQRDPEYPTADYLRSITWEGNSGNWGKPANEVLGEAKNSEASDAIIRVVDQSDSRPVWVCVWGGPQEVAQAIWHVQQTRSPAELDRFISKLRIYMIGLGSKTGQDGSGQWMLDNFPDLFVIVSQKTYGGMFAQKSPIGNLEWLNANIREGHGPLGAVYPRSGFNPDSPGIQEGDTPSFMYLVSAARGMNDPEHPDQESWGGQYEQRDPTKNHWYDGPGAESVRKWLPAIQKDFALRADWMLPHDTYNFRPRVIHTTDLGADPDDQMSMVRHFVVSNWFDTEGLVVNTGCWRKEQSNTDMLNALTDSYDQVVANLKVHDPAFPTAEYVRRTTVMGQTGYGMDDVGDGKDTAGSEMIIASVDKDDPRPLWATCWGGCNTIAQALWKVKNTRSAEDLATFVSKLHIYDILGQDNAGTWIAKTFPDILYIRATKVYSWQHSDEWADTHVQSHGPLGAAYPDPPWAYEGDSPAIFHLIPNGLHDPTVVTQGGWGGRFAAKKKTGIRGMSCMDGEDAMYDPYGMYNEADESINRWKAALQNDFAARMDWSITSNYEDANHHPIAILNEDETRRVLELSATVGSSVELRAAGSSDPDGDELSYSWWFYDEASSYDGAISIQGSNSASATVLVPADASGRDIHIVLEIQDNGSPSLTAYRRLIINVQ